MEDLAASDPATLGAYRTRAVLGEGGMGRVLLATGRHGNLVAIKRVHDHLAGDPEFRRRFRREVAASRRVGGAHTAAVVDADTDADVPWLATEFVYGPSLHQALDEVGSLPQDAVLRLAAGLAAALRDIHAARLVHRDLSPSNVLLADDGPRVIDFGIVRAAEGPAGTRRHTMTTNLTHTGTVIGAPGFMSPEQAEGRPLTSASDVFSLGTMLVTAYTGANPFEGPGIPQTMYNVVHVHPDLGALPERLRRVVAPCLAKDPAERPPPEGVLTLLGPAPEAERPWPARVHRLTTREREEVRGRVPDSDATTVTADPVPPTPTVVVPPPPPSGQRAGAIATAVVIVLALIVFAATWSPDDEEDTSGDDAGATADPTETWQDDGYDDAYDGEDDGWEDDDPTYEPDPETEPEPDPTTTEPPPPDPIEEAVEGDCFANYGDMWDMDLEPATCGDGMFEAVQIIDGSTDPDDCEGTPDADWSVNYPSFERSLCLSYQHPNGTAYHAEVGDCVYGPNSKDSVWEETGCETGNFTVVARYGEDSSWDDCDAQTWHHGRSYSVGSWPELDVRLCLTINYPDDAGRAEQNNCMVKSGPDSSPTFEFADCDASNVYVTGRTSTYNDPGFCGDDGATWWQNSDFPDLGYTVCWRWL